jgi:beta-lactamase regulating signal transducer with metallopeptidase domain
MTAINEMLQQPFSHAIGWALLQFVWQGTLIAALTAVLLAALRRSGPDVRYVISTIALALMLTTPVVTVVQTLSAPDPALEMAAGSLSNPAAAPEDTRVADAAASVAPRASSPRNDVAALAGSAPAVDEWLPLFVSLWLAGVFLLTLRLFSGWMWVQRMKSHGTHPAPEALQGAAERLMRRLHIGRAVRLLESTSVAVPTVIGWLKPVVLLPASALAGLSPKQLEAIVAHELAHIRRHDYIVNLLQTVVETLLFYHPAVWWLSHRIRAERENCCDDLAVSLCGDPVAYAAALAELEGLRSPTGGLVLAASGGSLLQRVRRLLGVPTHAGRAPGWLAAGAALLVLIGMSASALARGPFAGDQEVPVAVPPVQPAVPASPRPVVAVPVDAPALPIASTPAVGATPTIAPPALISATRLEAIAGPVASTPQVPPPAAVMATPVVPPLAQATPVLALTPAVPAVALPASTPIAALAPPVAGSPALPTPAVATTATAATPPVMSAMPVAAVPQTASTQSSSSSTASTSSSSTSRSDGQNSGNWVWSDNGRKVEVNYRGDIEFTDDDTDVKRLSPGGYLRIKDGGRFGTSNSVEFRSDSSGGIERRFWVGGKERPFEPEGRKWMSEVLPKFIRQSGIGAPARVTRIMKAGGASAVLAEISRIEGSFARRVYFTELLKQPGLSSANIQQALTQAGREIDSDFELASLLISSNRLVTDDAARRAYLDAARSIESDFELHRVLGSIVKAGPMSPAVAAGVLDASGSIASDFEQASLLAEFATNQQIDGVVVAPYFKALSGVSSSFEHHRALTALVRRGDLSAAARSAALESAATIDSDFELASFLLEFLKTGGVEKGERAAFFRATSSISSDFERGRVLQALARRSDVSDDTALEILRSTQTMSSDFERARILVALASTHPLSRAGRDAYIDTAEKLGNFEQGQVLAALVKNERRK